MSDVEQRGRWYLGSLNDGLFIIDRPPSPCGTDIPPDWGTPPSMVLNVTDLPQEKAQAIVDAHNAALSQPHGERGVVVDAMAKLAQMLPPNPIGQFIQPGFLMSDKHCRELHRRFSDLQTALAGGGHD